MKSLLRHLLVAAITALVAARVLALPVNTATAGNPFSNSIGNCTSQGGGNSSGAISASVVCGDAGGTNAGFAFAEVGHVGARATASVFSLCCFSTVGGEATYTDTVTFSGTGTDPIPVSINLQFAGTLNSTTDAGASVQGSVVIAGTQAGLLRAGSHNGLTGCTTNTFIGAVCGPNLVAAGAVHSNLVLVPLNTPVQIQLLLSVGADAGNVGASAASEFSNSLDFAVGMDLFNLPDGFTVNSETSFIVGNRFLPPAAAVPEPSVAALLVLGLAGLFYVTRRRRSVER